MTFERQTKFVCVLSSAYYNPSLPLIGWNSLIQIKPTYILLWECLRFNSWQAKQTRGRLRLLQITYNGCCAIKTNITEYKQIVIIDKYGDIFDNLCNKTLKIKIIIILILMKMILIVMYIPFLSFMGSSGEVIVLKIWGIRTTCLLQLRSGKLSQTTLFFSFKLEYLPKGDLQVTESRYVLVKV